MSNNKELKPVLKWVGGKRQLLNEIVPMIPDDYSVYVEPFVGGGAVLLKTQSEQAIISDYNEELINMYNVIKKYPDELIELLTKYKELNSKDFFYKLRGLDRDNNVYSILSETDKAARTIYLNKTCFNGLYRVNSKGEFNAPYGKYKNPDIINANTIHNISKYFNENHIQILCSDYKDILKNLDDNKCFVYLDPPYFPMSKTSAFTSYTKDGFDENKQVELKNMCDELDKKGIRFLQSNSDCEFIRRLYKDYKIKTVQAKRSINSNGNKRGKVNEVLIYNYDVKPY